ncbi:vacuolar proton translocating ATPase 116 kDa subunit a isoform 1 [Cryptosporidium ryanae]|uniref:vacuolar proton translocating ATPase 116 kDa subunit a isoform 1 n=1 Tax=Cryptosporidium ryanae TaxID=515981 RepID=UPI003519DD98|nr:vacuolar proton translocating ATPase 116 kDa subunit a isoform 1 [Cryptosporidium ryanae]
MGILRSESMSHGTLVLPNDKARDYIDILGREVNLQFVDMNSITMNRQYKKYIQRIDEMERILRVLYTEIEKLPDVKVIKGNYESFLDHDHLYQLDKVEESLQNLYAQFISFRDNNMDLMQQKCSAIEECAVAKAASLSFAPISMYNSGNMRSSNEDFYLTNAVERGESGFLGGNLPSSPLVNQRLTDRMNNISGFGEMMFSSIAGVVRHEDQEKFARALFRATRGNTFTHFQPIFEDITDPKTSKGVQKVVFVIYFQGATTSAVYDKISRICDAFSVSIYPWPSSYENAIQRIDELNALIQDKEKALQAYEQYITLEIDTLIQPVNSNNGNSLIEEWRLFCIKEKSIYATLNLFEGSDITLRADCWYPLDEEDKIRKILIAESSTQHVGAFLLTNTSSGSGAGIHIHEDSSHDDEANISNTPPTYIKTNGFTAAFQDFVNSYGVPRYQEINPALFTLVSFPFLFGIMYGDIGHGSIVFIIGLLLVFYHEKLSKTVSDENVKILMSGRYMITMMGFFATYCGLLYNDFFAAGLDLFGSRYLLSDEKLADGSHVYLPNNNSTSVSFPYPFGFDPVWKGAVNEMSFLNSFKMKFSVIIAFLQMTLGVLLKGFNNLYFKNYIDFFFEFVPQLIFMVGFIGYLNFLIFFKWLTPVSGYNKPSILNALIGLQSSLFGADIPLGERFYFSQPQVQKYITIALVISVPWMFFPKPLYLIYKSRKERSHMEENEKSHRQMSSYSSVSSKFSISNDFSSNKFNKSNNILSEEGNQLITNEHKSSGGGGHSDPTEIFIHQLIETVEFLIGSISNTASYLRLWALSLAHNMLALVALQFTILKALASKSLVLKTVQLFNLFFLFFAFTSFIMIVMDSLECFLHGLRLQWVEFQNKFYKGDGILFAPLNHLRIILETEEMLNSS